MNPGWSVGWVPTLGLQYFSKQCKPDFTVYKGVIDSTTRISDGVKFPNTLYLFSLAYLKWVAKEIWFLVQPFTYWNCSKNSKSLHDSITHFSLHLDIDKKNVMISNDVVDEIFTDCDWIYRFHPCLKTCLMLGTKHAWQFAVYLCSVINHLCLSWSQN